MPYFVARGPVPIPSGAFQGAGDIVSGARAWYGLRAYTAASIGGNAVKLRESGGNTTQIFTTIAGGGLDLSAISSFKGANNLFVDTLYDQTGNGFNLTQATTANQPGFSLASLGSLPTMTFNGTTQFLNNTSGPNGAVGSTFSFVAKNIYTTVQQSVMHINGTGGDQQTGFSLSGVNDFFVYAGAILHGTQTDGNYKACQAVFNNASSDANVDGVPSTGSASNNAPTATTLGLGATATGSAQWLSGNICEAGYWNATAFSGAQSSAMSANQHLYWGF